MLEFFLRVTQFTQSYFPAFFQLSGDQTVVGIGLVELPFGELGLVAQSLQLLLLSVPKAFIVLLRNAIAWGVDA